MKVSEQNHKLVWEIIVPCVVSILLIAVGTWLLTSSDDFLGKFAGGGIVWMGALGLYLTLKDAFKKWYRKRSRTIGKQWERVLASHSTGFHFIDITDEGVETRNLKIPFNSITECAFRRWRNRMKTACVIKYVDQQGRIREAELKGESYYSGLSIYTDILRISGQYGYKLMQQPHQEIVSLARQLACPPKIGLLKMRDSCRIRTGGSNSENKKVYGGAGISDSPGG